MATNSGFAWGRAEVRDSPRVVKTTICELLLSPRKYNHKLVRINAILLVSREEALLISSDNAGVGGVRLDFDKMSEKDPSFSSFSRSVFRDVVGHDLPVVDIEGKFGWDTTTNIKTFMLRRVKHFVITHTGKSPPTVCK